MEWALEADEKYWKTLSPEMRAVIERHANRDSNPEIQKQALTSLLRNGSHVYLVIDIHVDELRELRKERTT